MAGNKEIEVEDFATIAQTNNILGSSIGEVEVEVDLNM